jgi:hypothetical protein
MTRQSRVAGSFGLLGERNVQNREHPVEIVHTLLSSTRLVLECTSRAYDFSSLDEFTRYGFVSECNRER